MESFFYSIDLTVFYFFNHTLSTPFLDRLFSIITDVNSWFITYIIFWGLLIVKGGKRGRIAAVLVILLVTFCDQTGHNVLKEIFERIRPCNALPDVLTPMGCSGTFSFPSNHALNNFAVAAFFYRLYPKYVYPLFIAASLIAISRVYLGVHYPSDIIAGAAVGSLFGWLFAMLQTDVLEKKLFTGNKESRE